MLSRRIAALGAVLALAAACPPADPPAKIRGVIVSTHTSGHEWGSDAMGPTLDELRGVGAAWVAIHPYARIEDDGTVSFRAIDPAAPPAALARPIREAHARGMSIAVMPHLAHWGSRFSWRGAIGFGDDPDGWQRFFTSYAAWIDTLATACADADLLVVGNELDTSLGHEARWRALIASVRSRTRARLTYAANWTHYREVPFWEDLDLIGVQAYFPVASRTSPDEAELRSGWARVMAEIRAYARAQRRPVLFTELGYNRSYAAAMRPWSYDVDDADAEVVQARCLRAALAAVEAEPSVAGAFLWKWFPQPHTSGRTFQLATPRVRRAIADAWAISRPGGS